MADPLSARQQIVDKIKEASNILVTVSQDPSVDQLSAALGLTVMLNNISKHATAVVSGAIPPAVSFLEPEKTFEGTIDSLRDFIIALDKEKADHLRYKVDGDVVKIFITPYKTTISEQDLDFSQGDYNVELVLALGVEDEAHLDKALEAHGKILHDATVATISAGGAPSKLGSIDWRDDTASSLSEMLVSISEAIKGDKPLLDEQSATALLTGIVAATDRFSNDKTSSKVMTMSAQLMAAGANQQLIATKLQEARAIGDTPTNGGSSKKSANKDGTTELQEDTAAKLEETTDTDKKKEGDGTAGGLAINHEKEGDIDAVAKQVASEEGDAATQEAEAAAGSATSDPNLDEIATAEKKLAEELAATIPTASEPILGGTLNATTEQAAADALKLDEQDRNKAILTHNEAGHVTGATIASPINSSVAPDAEEPPTVDVFNTEPSTPPTLADIDARARGVVQPPVDTTSLPPLPDFSTLPPPPPPLPLPPPLPGESETQPPSTDTVGGGAVSPEKLAELFGKNSSPSAPPAEPGPVQDPNDPGQFKIPGQS